MDILAVTKKRMQFASFWFALILTLIETGWMLVILGWDGIHQYSDAVPSIFSILLLIASIFAFRDLFLSDVEPRMAAIRASLFAVLGIALSTIVYGPFFVVATLEVLFFGFGAPLNALYVFSGRGITDENVIFTSIVGFILSILLAFTAPVITIWSPKGGYFIFFVLLLAMALGVVGCVQKIPSL